MIIFALPGEIKRAKRILVGNLQWCYLGKDLSRRAKISQTLGEESRFYLKGRLQIKTEELRQSYINFIAQFGKGQRDSLNWWASKFASKNQWQIDFFLLLCYKAIAEDLIKEKCAQGKFMIFIEDPWLFSDIKNSFGVHKDIIFLGNPRLAMIKFLLGIRGCLQRLLLVGWVIIARGLVYCFHKGKKPGALKARKSALCFVNPAEGRAFKDGRYLNCYMPGLAEFYKENDISFFYLYILNFPLSTSKLVGANKEVLWPLILDVKLLEVVKRAFDHWRPIWGEGSKKNIEKYDIALLLERERWIEFSKVGFNIHLILFDALDYFFSKGWCHSVVYAFENQTWEKILCMAAQKNNVRTFGYLHFPIFKDYLSQFLGQEEEGLFAPLPYKLFTLGRQSADLYKQGGIPKEKIEIAGAWRYKYLIDNKRGCNRERIGKDLKPIALVCLPIDIKKSKSLLENLLKVVSENSLSKDVEFWLKAHPGNTRRELNKIRELVAHFKNVNQPIDQLFKSVDMLITTETTIGLEAFFYGKRIITFIPENLFASDPLLDIPDERIYKWHEGEELDLNFIKRLDSVLPSPGDILAIKEKYFSRINHKLWLECNAEARRLDEAIR